MIHGNRLKVYFSRAEDETADEEMERILNTRDESIDSEEIETESDDDNDNRKWIPPGEDFAVVIP